MPNSSYSNDPLNMQPTDAIPPMEDLSPRPVVPQTPPVYEHHVSHPPHASHEVDIEHVEARQDEARTVKFAIAKLNDFLNWFILVLEVTLLIRFIFRLIGASTTNPFAMFLYALTDIILFPFSSLVPNPAGGHQVFEFTTLIGMALYYLFFYAIRRFLHILISEPEEPIE